MKSDRVMLEMVSPGSLLSKLVLKVESVLPKSIGKVSVETDSLVGICVGVSGGVISSRMDGLTWSSLRRRMVGFTPAWEMGGLLRGVASLLLSTTHTVLESHPSLSSNRCLFSGSRIPYREKRKKVTKWFKVHLTYTVQTSHHELKLKHLSSPRGSVVSVVFTTRYHGNTVLFGTPSNYWILWSYKYHRNKVIIQYDSC